MKQSSSCHHVMVLALVSAEEARDWKRVRQLLRALSAIGTESGPCSALKAFPETIGQSLHSETTSAATVIGTHA
jgi:hypothetical protein